MFLFARLGSDWMSVCIQIEQELTTNKGVTSVLPIEANPAVRLEISISAVDLSFSPLWMCDAAEVAKLKVNEREKM